MKKILMVLALLFAFNTAYAAAAGGGDWMSYYQNMLRGLKSKVQKKFESKNRVSAVAAVRGVKQGSDAEALYWKGGVSEKAREKLAEEKKILTEAVQLIVEGGTPEGKAALEKFIKDNPESLYVPDAREALANLPKEEPAAPPVNSAREIDAEKSAGAQETKPAGTRPEETKADSSKPAEAPKTEKGQ